MTSKEYYTEIYKGKNLVHPLENAYEFAESYAEHKLIVQRESYLKIIKSIEDENIKVLKSLNKYFINLQSKVMLDPIDELAWKKISNILNK